MKRKVWIVFLLVLVLLGCAPRWEPAEGTREVLLEPVWTFRQRGVYYNVYEFTDLERGQHCYVIVGGEGSSVALSCESIGEGR